jgi:HTH-type transcriptional regulator, global nitrogen regulator NrpRI
MVEKIEKKRLAILRILKDSNKPLASAKITDQLFKMGYDISDRTVRFHLLSMDKDGLTKYIGKHGREITNTGIQELSKARIYDKVGYLSAKIDKMTYRMNFDLAACKGDVVVNISLIKKEQRYKAFPIITRVFDAGYSMGHLLTVFEPGEQIGEFIVPDGYLGIGTVCSITLNGVLLANGIPVKSRFGGILEIEKSKPVRFIAIINYDGTSLDPLEIFIKCGMTDYTGAVKTGNGLIGASFREIPAESRDKVLEISRKLEKIGLGGVFDIGWSGHQFCEIPINEGLVGMIVLGGLNPVAILEEYDIPVQSNALSGLVDYDRLYCYKELKKHL